MSNFTDGAPKTYLEWLQLGFVVIPCNKQGIPMVQKWQQQI